MNEFIIPGGLIRDIRALKPAVFLGAGASICSALPENERLPLGEEVIEELLKYYYNKDFGEPEELKKVFKKDFGFENITPEIVWSKVLEKDSKNLLPHHKILNKLFDQTRPIPPNYKYFARLTLMDIFSTVLTTNFDEKLDLAFDKIKKETVRINSFFSASTDDDFKYYRDAFHNFKMIYKLHGTLSNPHTIRSSNEELRGDLSESKYEVFKDLFKYNNIIIFIGYSCKDDDVYKALLKISKTHQKNIWWINLEFNSRIDTILKAFNSEKNCIPVDSYIFLKNLHEQLIPAIHPSKKYYPEKEFLHEYGTDVINKLGINKNFYDPLYGVINFDDEYGASIINIINSGDIQRLRDIKQLSFVHYHYPGATHSRFQHSLGVAFLVSKALQSLKKKGAEISLDDKRNTIYAAILHDLGHGPFSHVCEMFAEKSGRPHDHEKYTLDFIEKGLLDLHEIMNSIPITRKDVLNTIRYTLKRPSKYPQNMFLSSLIGKYALDFDRIDFLLRDFYYITNYDLIKGFNKSFGDPSTFDGRIKLIETLTTNVDVGTHSSHDDAKLLCFEEKIKPLLDSLLNLYVEMYLKVYYSRTDLCARSMMVKALEIANDLGEISFEDLYQFTDSELFSFLENIDSGIVKKILWSVKYRRFFTPIVEFKATSPTMLTSKNIEDRIKEEFNIEEKNFDSLLMVGIPQKKGTDELFLKDSNGDLEKYDITQFIDRINNNMKGYVFASWKSKINSPTKQEELTDFLKDLLKVEEVQH